MLLTNDQGDAVTCTYVAGTADRCQVANLSSGAWLLTATVVDVAGNPVSGIEVVDVTVIDVPTTVVQPDESDESLPSVPADQSISIALMASLLALAALKRRDQLGLERLDRNERDESGVVTFAAGSGSGGLDMKSDVYCPPCIPRFDMWIKRSAFRSSHVSPAFGRCLDDGSYLRGLIGIFWPLLLVVGAVLGSLAASSTDGVVALPELWIVVALLIVGSLDALAGVVAAVSYGLAILVHGGFDTTDAAISDSLH
jgi:hypothetical protein